MLEIYIAKVKSHVDEYGVSTRKLNRVGRILAQLDLGLGIAFLLVAGFGLLFRLAGFMPTGTVFAGFGTVLIIIFLAARRQGYPSPGQVVSSYVSINIPKEETTANPMVSITLKTGLSDQVHIFVEGKEIVSSSWTFGRKRMYDLMVHGEKMKVELRRGVGGPRYELYSNGTLLSEGRLQPESLH